MVLCAVSIVVYALKTINLGKTSWAAAPTLFYIWLITSTLRHFYLWTLFFVASQRSFWTRAGHNSAIENLRK